MSWSNKTKLYITPHMTLHLLFMKDSSRTYVNDGTPGIIYMMEEAGLVERTTKVVEAWKLTLAGQRALEDNFYKMKTGYKYTDRDKE
jgi:hypothetical protein